MILWVAAVAEPEVGIKLFAFELLEIIDVYACSRLDYHDLLHVWYVCMVRIWYVRMVYMVCMYGMHFCMYSMYVIAITSLQPSKHPMWMCNKKRNARIHVHIHIHTRTTSHAIIILRVAAVANSYAVVYERDTYIS